jgi:3-carboxy-cis,cis-muconate cycloisomerase
MMRLADQLGRERAHDVVYEAVGHCRATGEPLFTALRAVLPTEVAATIEELPPESYVGRPHETVDAALTLWGTES